MQDKKYQDVDDLIVVLSQYNMYELIESAVTRQLPLTGASLSLMTFIQASEMNL